MVTPTANEPIAIESPRSSNGASDAPVSCIEADSSAVEEPLPPSGRMKERESLSSPDVDTKADPVIAAPIRPDHGSLAAQPQTPAGIECKPDPSPIRVRVVGRGRISEAARPRAAEAVPRPAPSAMEGEGRREPAVPDTSRKEVKAFQPPDIEPAPSRVGLPSRDARSLDPGERRGPPITPDRQPETPVTRAGAPDEPSIVIENLTVEVTRTTPAAPRKRKRGRKRPAPIPRNSGGTMLRFGIRQL
jgi:hypothetical protein